MVKTNQLLRTLCSVFLLFVVINGQHKEVKYASLKGVIKKSLPQNGFVEKDSIFLTKKQANELNDIYDAGYKKNKKILIHVLKNPDSTVACYVVRVKLLLYEFESLHDYAIIFAPDKKTLAKVEILQLNDEYAELIKKKDVFLEQFETVTDVDSLETGKNIDAVTEATLSSDLTVKAVRIAKDILTMVKG